MYLIVNHVNWPVNMVLLDAIYGVSEFSAGVKILVYYMYNITLVSFVQ